ncbi:hypothetical protein FNV43_RR07523 [Rhamnella rubrinervis]|uniref:Uncharacterized protein n=1 Tax=Rhamnella rubrinervis TaxID=2594499 RepID=A0A8K0HG21_9ROSA|nr:hypothetical protein FNV43_RR07523 [Rhamnella rubrinervis]
MAEALVSVLLEQLVPYTGKKIAQEVTSIRGAEKDVRKLNSNLQDIKAVLDDAEKKQLTDLNVRRWLNELKDVSYDMDDVLDEWRTAILESKIKKEERHVVLKKVCLHIPSSCFALNLMSLRRHIACQIKEINERLDVITKEKDKFSFRTSSAIEQGVERPKTVSYVDVSKIQGRDKVRDHLIVSKLLRNNADEQEGVVMIIPIVGMGGIGKTTLAQQVYNDDRVNDLWTKDEARWDKLKQPLRNGALGSKILVTTRKEEVVRMMEATTSHKIDLKLLSEEECWLVFSHGAFLGRNEEERRQLEDIGRKISSKCKGLSLAARILGSLVRIKKTREEWEKIWHNNIWETDDAKTELFAPLLLKSEGEARNAQLVKREHLVELELDFASSRDDFIILEGLQPHSNSRDDLIILEGLQPHSNLKSLGIFCYGGRSMCPTWMMSLTNLRQLRLHECKNFRFLPPLGKLPSLELLDIRSNISVEVVGLEFLGADDASITCCFPKLRELSLMWLTNSVIAVEENERRGNDKGLRGHLHMDIGDWTRQVLPRKPFTGDKGAPLSHPPHILESSPFPICPLQ